MNNEIKEVDQWFITYGGCAVFLQDLYRLENQRPCLEKMV